MRDNRWLAGVSVDVTRSAKQGASRSRRDLMHYLLRFAVMLMVGQFGYYGLLRPHAAFGGYLAGLAAVSAAILRAFGASVEAHGNVVHGQLFSFSIVTDCDAIEPTLFFLAGVLAYPVGGRLRLLAAGAGAAAIVVINQLRIISLYFVGSFWPGAFVLVHEGIWQPTMILVTFCLWYAFVNVAVSRRPT